MKGTQTTLDTSPRTEANPRVVRVIEPLQDRPKEGTSATQGARGGSLGLVLPPFGNTVPTDEVRPADRRFQPG